MYTPSILTDSSTEPENMGANSVFLYVNFKAIFCVALVAALTNIVSTQNLYMSMLDDARDALMSFSSGSSPTSLPGGWSGFSGYFFYLNLIDFAPLFNNTHTCASLRRNLERKINCFSRIMMPKTV